MRQRKVAALCSAPRDCNMVQIVVADIGGTHARFAIAEIGGNDAIHLDDIITMRTSDHASLQIAWQVYEQEVGRPLPHQGAIAVAAPVNGGDIHFTNSSWMVRPSLIGEKLALERFSLVNDFGAVCHAIAMLGDDMFGHVCGPDKPASQDGIVTVVGPGTGLGAAYIKFSGSDYSVSETEGGHIDFAPHDAIEDHLLQKLRQDNRRVSAERVVAGPALQNIYRLFAEAERTQPKLLDDKALWQLALSGTDSIASAALDRFCLCLGSISGDLALAHGAHMVVIAGGLGGRIGSRLPESGFTQRFVNKGRFQSMMEKMPVKHLKFEEPGLYGAAVAFLKEHGK